MKAIRQWFLVALLLAGCSSLGLQKPESFTQQLAFQYGNLTAVYNATFQALSTECFDLGASGMIGYPVTAETGGTAMGCVAD